MADYEIALSIAMEEHKGQIDKSGKCYIEHPIHLASQFEDEEVKCAAILHDVIEDGSATPSYLKLHGFSQKVIDMVVCLTRRPEETYFEYIKKIRHHVYQEVREIKIADLKHNMDITRIAKVREVTKEDLSRLKKYTKAYRILIK